MAPRERRWRPWAGALLGGVAGTTVMTAALAVETALRPNAARLDSTQPGSAGPVDYDASEHVVIAACRAVGRRPPHSDGAKRAIFATVHWGYGSAVALAYEPLRRTVGSDRRAGLLFYAGCQSMALVLFPVLGGTPPPWRWKRPVLLSSLTVHALYVATVVAVSRASRRISP